MPSWHAVLGCKFPPLGSGGHAAGWTSVAELSLRVPSVAGLSLRVPIRRDCMPSWHAVLGCRNPPPDFWGDYCRDTRHFVVRSNPCSPKAIKGFRPALNAIAPALDEGSQLVPYSGIALAPLVLCFSVEILLRIS